MIVVSMRLSSPLSPLACINPRYLPFAVIAQVDRMVILSRIESGIITGLLPAALGNAFLVLYLVLDLWHSERGFHFPKLAWLASPCRLGGLLSYLVVREQGSKRLSRSQFSGCGGI
ncbi:hypothetical protein [Bradyrhizobium sp. 23]|uniref:hypothetical protein n=1 Tax=Bradyrhizobium sp. 23 TaxID=2782667 RepID=UPI001FF8EF7A|nr:hypothetical protein [Bradyrhizobium sp. 23]MCK1312428.1 hypothetical protein [Bradyrhizobium sp. 23]